MRITSLITLPVSLNTDYFSTSPSPRFPLSLIPTSTIIGSMESNLILILSYIVFIWMVVIHTFEEISHGIMELDLGRIQVTRTKYLRAASAISTLNLGVLTLLILGLPVGYYLATLTSAVIGVLQAAVHGYGYFKEGRQTTGLGVGFYTSIPLAAAGLVVFMQCSKIILN